MMKNILVIFTFLLSIILTGCGSNSKPDGIGGSVVGTTADYSLVAVPDVIDIAEVGETKTIKLFLNDNVALEPVEGKVIKAKVFDQNFGTLSSYSLTTDVNGYVGFDYTAPETALPTQSLVITFELENSVPVLEKNVTVSFNGTTVVGSDVNTTGYQLVAVPDVIDIAAGGETANIDLYLNDTVNLVTVPNVVIKAQVFDQTNGTLDTYEVTTDSTGHAPFVYTAPNTLPATSLVITFEVKGGVPALTKDVTVNFSGSTAVTTDVNTTGYQLVAVPDVIDIAAGGETTNIDLYLNDMVNLSAVPNVVIKAQIFDQTNGTLNTYEVTTDSNGHAPFVYTAPNTLPATSLVITFEVKGGVPPLTKDVTVNFSGSTTVTTDVNTTGYQLVAVPDVVDITAGGETANIDLYLNDLVNLVTVPNVVIKAQVFDQTSGTLDTYEVTTDSNGHAPFVYTAPNTLPSTSLVITFEVKGGVPALEKTVTVNFNGSTGPTTDVNTTNYQLVAVPEVVNIATGGERADIDLYLNNTATLSPVPNVVIKAQVFDQTNGTLDTYEVTTDSTGHAPFVYTAPNTLPAASLLITFEVKGGVPALEKVVTVSFSTTASSEYNLTNVTTPIVINYANQVETISAYVVDSLNVGVAGKTVTISTPLFGDMTSATAVSNAAGKVEFSYQAPADLTGLSGTVVTMYFTEGGVTYQADVNITVSPATTGTSEYNLTNVSTPIDVHFASEIKEISVQLIKNDGTPQVGETIVAKSIPAEFGSISNVSVTTGTDGYARFTYVAADPLTDGVQPLELYYDDIVSGERISVIVDINVTEETLPLPYVVIPDAVKENNLSVNNELVELPIKVFIGGTNTPYSTGKVKVQLPANVIDGVDVGSFDAYEVDIVNGIATFNYTGPNDLQGLIDSGELNSTFMFYHEDNPTDKKPVVMIYDPDPAQGYIPVNYELIINSQDGNMTMGLEEEKSFSATLKDDLGNLVPDSNITSFTITSKNILVGKLLDNGIETNTLTILGQNPVNFNVRTNTKSGLLPIDITVNFVDSNGIATEMNQTINIVVYSGPATAMSISYVGVEQDGTSAKYIEKFAVTVVDAYNNRVNTQPFIAVGGMVEYAVDGSSVDGERNTSSPRLWYGKFDAPHGSVVPDGVGGATFETVAASNIFQWVDFSNDKLVVFGEGYVYEALGKWDISQGVDTSSLTLLDEYYGVQRDDLFYAVGHNNRVDLCSGDGREYVGYAKSDTYQVGTDGTALVEFVYDYHLTGKDIMLWVNLTGYQADTATTTRIGEARKHTLRGNGLMTPDEWTLPAGSSSVLPFRIHHTNAPEWYINAHFSYSVVGDCAITGWVDSSNWYDARTCGPYGGVAYVELNVSNPSTGDCTITLENINVANEF